LFTTSFIIFKFYAKVVILTYIWGLGLNQLTDATAKANSYFDALSYLCRMGTKLIKLFVLENILQHFENKKVDEMSCVVRIHLVKNNP